MQKQNLHKLHHKVCDAKRLRESFLSHRKSCVSQYETNVSFMRLDLWTLTTCLRVLLVASLGREGERTYDQQSSFFFSNDEFSLLFLTGLIFIIILRMSTQKSPVSLASQRQLLIMSMYFSIVWIYNDSRCVHYNKKYSWKKKNNNKMCLRKPATFPYLFSVFSMIASRKHGSSAA